MVRSADLKLVHRGMDNCMPTWDATQRFEDDHAQLSAELRRGGGFRPGLRVRGVQGAPGIFEMTWAPDGRATFEYGDPIHPGEAHVVWRRVGSHAILANP
jgi:hypothetical protein